MTGYVIRGGAEGKARLSVVSAALAPSTAAVLDAAGLGEGMRCLDLGCGGGDVTLAIGRAVGPGGSVVGIDMDAVKIELARQDAAEAVATPQEMETLATALETFSSDTDTISSLPRIFQASGRRPG